jgi:hypothetical protein
VNREEKYIGKQTIEDLRTETGRITEFVFEHDTFMDPDEGDALRYVAYLNDSDQLPSWVEFDGLARKFTFSPTRSDMDRISLRVVDRDYEGLTTESRFEIHLQQARGSENGVGGAT